ncbi:TPA_asm: Eac protein, partial [Salmonella enterica subsp. enterica serovar Heidelberg]|nr:Eac protein [Salmonella enterica subsp. enterica serovar Heidelberg]
MSGQSKYYDYYMVEGEDVKELIQSYDTINDQRNSILTTAAEK